APPVMPLPFVLCPLLFALCSLLFALVIDYRGCSRENSGNPTAPRHRLDRSSGPASLDSRLSDPPRRRKDDPMPCRVPPRAGHCRWAVLALLATAFLAWGAVADPPGPKVTPHAAADSTPSPAPKKLSEADAKHVAELTKSIDTLWRAGKFTEAVEPARQVTAIDEKALGPDHWQTADANRKVETLRTIAALPEEGRRALADLPALQQEFLGDFEKARYMD